MENHPALPSGGPDGEMGASMRYLSQRYAMPYREVMGTMTDIGAGEGKTHRKKLPLGEKGSFRGLFNIKFGRFVQMVRDIFSVFLALPDAFR